jgi:hypothetical protein
MNQSNTFLTSQIFIYLIKYMFFLRLNPKMICYIYISKLETCQITINSFIYLQGTIMVHSVSTEFIIVR